MSMLEQAKVAAQADANRSGEPIALLNLNRVGPPMYVRRFVTPNIEKDRAYVGTFYPENNKY